MGLEPIDLVLMIGDRLGDRSSELERYIARDFRFRRATSDEVTFDFGDSPTGTSLATLQPLLSRLRRLITGRAAHAADWRRAADVPHGNPGDPTGSASGHSRLEGFSDLVSRLGAAVQSLQSAHSELVSALAIIEPLHEALNVDASSIVNPQWTGSLDRVRRALFALTRFGIPEAVPADGDTVSASVIDRLIPQARVVAALTRDRVVRAQDLMTVPPVSALPTDDVERFAEIARRNGVLRDRYLEAAKAVFGPVFVIIPLFQFAADQRSEVDASLTARLASAADVEEWLLTLARVRPRMADLAWALAAARWGGHAIAEPATLQLPHHANVPWIGGTLGSDFPAGEWLSLVVVGSAATSRPLLAGLLLDEWTETVPNDNETTGVAFNFDRPNAVAPHALLVAVAPVLRGNWLWDDLVGSVHEALDLAAIRAVEPDALLTRNENTPAPAGDYFHVLPAILAEFTAGRVVATDFAVRAAAVLAQPIR
jgi:hypothetical protein